MLQISPEDAAQVREDAAKRSREGDSAPPPANGDGAD